jgi:cytochrome c553
MHKLLAGVFNAGGGVELKIDVEGPGLPRQSIVPHVFLTEEGPPKPKEKKADPEHFPLEPELVRTGKGLFMSAGCASCHQLKEAKPLAQEAPGLAKLRPHGGCLDTTPKKGLPWYGLSASQRTALTAALKAEFPAKPQAAEVIHRTLTSFNCYACHERGKIGGPEDAFNPFFLTTQPEMGDEGRLPPSLGGVGAKLKAAHARLQGRERRPSGQAVRCRRYD